MGFAPGKVRAAVGGAVDADWGGSDVEVWRVEKRVRWESCEDMSDASARKDTIVLGSQSCPGIAGCRTVVTHGILKLVFL